MSGTEEVDTQLDSTNETETGAENEGRPAERQLSPRELAMEAIAEKINSEWAGQEEDQGQGDDQANAEPVAVPDQDRPKLVKVKVDGQELEVPEAEVIASYQIRAHAQNKVNEANALKEQAEAIQRQAEQELEAARGKGDASVTDEDVLERSKSILTAMLEDGDIDSAAEGLAALISQGRGNKAAVDVDAIAERVRQKSYEEEFNRDYERAREMFTKDFADINADPQLAEMCNLAYRREVETGKLPTEAAKAAGKATREWVQKISGKSSPVTNLNERAARKQSIDTITSATGRMSSTAANQADDALSVVAEMKRARGQA